MMRRLSGFRLAAFASVVVVLWAMTSPLSHPAQAADYPATFKVGGIFNLTGVAANQGAEFLHGLEHAATTYNEGPGKGIGGSRIQVIAEDMGAAEPAKAVAAAQKLIQVDGVKVLANVYTSPVLAVMPICEKAQVLQITAGATSPRLANVSRLFMADVANAALEAEVGLAFARKALGAKKIAIIYGNDDFGTAVRDVATKAWTAGGGTITGSEGVAPNQTEIASIATKLAAGKPDIVYVSLAGGNIGASVKQLREAGITVPLIGQQGFESQDLFTVAGSAAEKSFWTSAAVTVDQTKNEAFTASYKKAYGQDPTIYARNHYDLGMTLFAAATELRKQGKEWTGENLRNAMLALGTYVGVTGPFSYRPDGTALRRLDIKTFHEGKSSVHLTAAQIQTDNIYQFAK
jgi:branched-chain amino acid transport system substrate-binding protein